MFKGILGKVKNFLFSPFNEEPSLKSRTPHLGGVGGKRTRAKFPKRLAGKWVMKYHRGRI